MGRRPCGKFYIAAVLPAHNEETTISGAVKDLVYQTYAVDEIIVVDDCSTDGTARVLRNLQQEVPQLVVIRNTVPALRAGAVNCGLEYVAREGFDYVLVADADSRFDRNLVKQALRWFRFHPLLGGVCSGSGVLASGRVGGSWWKRFEAWIMWRLQRLDWAGFDAERTATWQNVRILHGLCTVYRVDAITSVGGYTPNHLLEDYDLTLKLKEAGWWVMYNPRMRAWTKVPVTFRAFMKQRLRWMRGGVDVLLDHGISRHTAEDALQHLLFILLLIGVIGYIGLTGSMGWRIRFNWHPIPVALAIWGYLVSLRRLIYVERCDGFDIAIRALVFPELFVAVVLSVLRIYAYYLAVFRRPQNW